MRLLVSKLLLVVGSVVALMATSSFAQSQSIARPWSGHGHDPQHTAVSPVKSQPLQQIKWQTPVDLAP